MYHDMCEHCGSTVDVAEAPGGGWQLCLLCLLAREVDPLTVDFLDQTNE